MVVRFGGMNIKCFYPVHCPKVKDIVLVSRGSGDLRGNLKHNWQKMSKSEIARPLIRNRVIKKRTEQERKLKKKGASIMHYDSIKSDNVKRILKNF
jgi:hypothetical protein